MSTPSGPPSLPQFLQDVRDWEGEVVADETLTNCVGNGKPVSASPILALFHARRTRNATSLIAAQTMFASKCESRKD